MSCMKYTCLQAKAELECGFEPGPLKYDVLEELFFSTVC